MFVSDVLKTRYWLHNPKGILRYINKLKYNATKCDKYDRQHFTVTPQTILR